MPLDNTYLQVSDGTGDASIMHVTANRSIGSTIIAVDTLVGVPQKFIATYGKVNAQGFIDPTTARTFYGKINGANLEIEGWAPGSVDNGNDEQDVVVIKPNTVWANKVVDSLNTVIASSENGWVAVPNSVTATYVSATQFTLQGDWTGVLSKGDKIKITNGTTKFFYVINFSYSAPNTTVTVYAGTSYSLASGSISAVSYSKMESPVGFPSSFTLADFPRTYTGGSLGASVAIGAGFRMQGREVTFWNGYQLNVVAGATNTISMELPATLADLLETSPLGSISLAATFHVMNPLNNPASYTGYLGEYEGSTNRIHGPVVMSTVTSQVRLVGRFTI